LFSRRFTCAKCGYSLVASKTKGHVYYRCYVADCVTTSIREERLFDAINLVLRQLRLPAPLVAALGAQLQARATDAEANAEQRRRSLTASLQVVERRLSRLADLYMDGEVDKVQHADKRRELLEQRQMFQQQLIDARSSVAADLASVGRIFELAETPDLQFEMASAAEKRALVDSLTCNRAVTAKTVAISLSPPFDVIATMANSLPCRQVQYDLRTVDGLIDIVLETLRDEKARVYLNNLLSLRAGISQGEKIQESAA
jgi:hypothetical protein